MQIQDSSQSSRIELSIVATLYRSALYIKEFCDRAAAVSSSLVGENYEIILVNDGSPDDSLKIAAELSKTNPHILVIDLSRNFGHHKAMMTGLAYSVGERVFLLDIDLEEEPEWLLSFVRQMENEQCDVVYGQQATRKGGVFERWSGELYYSLFNMVTKLNVAKNQVTARLMTRRYVDSLLRHQEREIMILGLWHITGFYQRPQLVVKRNTSETTYTLRHKMAILVNSITSFSAAPLIYIFYIGLAIFLLAGTYTSYLVLNWLLFSKPLEGWTSLMASIWLLGGAIIFFLGVIGIYLSKIYMETKERPYTIVRKFYGREN